MSIIAAGATDIGQKRKTNQDSICLLPEKNFFAVADGMGGHSGGDIASQTSVALMPQFLSNNENLDPAPLIEKCIKHVNHQIYNKASLQPELKGMGTTISAVLFKGGILTIGNVGDSRVYMVHDQKLYQMTRDHSFVQEKINMGIYTREEALNDPQKNVLVRSVGFEEAVEVDVFNYRICKNDIFLVCSDGLHAKVSDHDILHVVRRNISDSAHANQEQVEKTVQELIALANANGGQDNISVIIAIAQQ